jgi:PucR family transcriptional regulator, proline-responsive transcriptional activator
MFSFQEIVNKLSNYNPESWSMSNLPVQDVFFLENEHCHHPHMLYFTTASKLLPFIERLNRIHLLIMEDQPLTAETKERLKDSQCAFITVSGETNWSGLFNDVKSIFSIKSDSLRHSFQLYDQLLNLTHLSQVLEVMEEEFLNPTIVVDDSFKVLHYSKKMELTDHIWAKNIRQGYCSYEFIAEIKKIKTFRNSPISTEPFKVHCHENKIGKWVCKILIEGKLAGYIVVPECHTELTLEQSELMPLFSKIAMHHVSKAQYQHYSKDLSEDRLLIDILEDKITTQTELTDRLKWSGLSLRPYKWLVRIKAHSDNRSTTKSTGLQTQLQRLFPDSQQIIYHDSLLLLVTSKEEFGLTDEKLRLLEDILEDKKMNAIYSDGFSDLLELPQHYKRIKKAQQTAIQLGKTDILLSYTSMKFYQILEDFPDKQQLIAYCHPAILKLLEYDKQNHTDYYQTLQTYLFNNQNLNQTAELLFVHRNTMKYRLKKINELTGITLKNGMPIFQLAYSFMILNYLQRCQ